MQNFNPYVTPMKNIYLFLAILGTIIPYAVFLPWIAQHGLDLPLLFREMFRTRIAAFFSLDVIVSALVVFVLAFKGQRRGVPNVWIAVLGTLVVGVSLGLPLYLYFEARQKQNV